MIKALTFDLFGTVLDLEKSTNPSIKNLLDNNKAKEVKDLLDKIIKLYQSNSEIIDHIYIEQLSTDQFKQNLSFTKDKDNKVVKIK